MRICLDSKFPIVIWWGPELRMLYNDAWRPALGTKKDRSRLGAPGRQVWSDVWDTIGPVLESVMNTGKPSWENDQLLLFDRYGYVEETYWTNSYSAIRLSSGEVGGVFSAVEEVTDRVLSARRMKTLREVADQVVLGKNQAEACTLTMQAIKRNPADCPYAMIFLCQGDRATRVAATFDEDEQIPATIDLSLDDPWALKETVRSRTMQVFAAPVYHGLPSAPFGKKCDRVVSIPVFGPTREVIVTLTIGLSPYRRLDGPYRDFLESLAKNLATNINNARLFDAERSRAEAMSVLAAIVSSSDDAIVSKNLDGVITSWNKSAERIFGYTAEEVVGKHITLIIPPDHRDEEAGILARLRKGERIDHFQTVRMRKDGTTLDVSLSISPVRDATGKVIGASKVARDITAQKRAQQAARESEERFRLTFENAAVGIAHVGQDGRWLRVNNKLCEIVGYSRQELLQKRYQDITHPEDLDRDIDSKARVASGVDETYSTEKRYVRKDGSIAWVYLTVSALRDARGKLVHFISVLQDIAVQKAAQAKLHDLQAQTSNLAEKLEGDVRARTAELENRNADLLRQSDLVRELSWRLLRAQDDERRHIARELHDSAGQTLTVLSMNLAQLGKIAAHNSPHLVADVKRIEESVQQLHREIRTASYLLHPPLLDESGLASALGWYTQGLSERSGLDIDLRIADDFGRIPGEMELIVFRVVQECLTNIHRHSGSKRAIIRIARQPDTVTVRVADSGKGISPKKLGEIQSSGSGVGIRGMRERLRQFHGNLSIDSNEAGTTVCVTIPLPGNFSEQQGTPREPISSTRGQLET